MWKKLFLLLIVVEIIAVFAIYKYSDPLEAATVVIRPTADGPIGQWTASSPSGHFLLVDDNVINPTAADTADFISVPGTGSRGAEVEELFFDIPRPFDAITRIGLWIYGQNSLCNGGGASNCDTVKLTETIGADSLTLKDDIAFNIGSYTWTNISFDTTSTSTQDYLNLLDSQSTTTIKISFTRNAKGGGNNNDNLSIAAVYIELTTSPEKGGNNTETKLPSVQTSGATDRKGGNSNEGRVFKDTQKGSGSISGGGENSE